MKDACLGCHYRGVGAVQVSVHGREEGTWNYTKTAETFPPCDLPDNLFMALLGLKNFAGRVYSQTSQDGKKTDVRTANKYGTDGIEIPAGTCVGRSAAE